jgi:hypothetical protein
LPPNASRQHHGRQVRFPQARGPATAP